MDLLGPAGPCWETGVRWFGTALALVGAFIANPDATRHHLHAFSEFMRSLGRAIQRLMRWFRHAILRAPKDHELVGQVKIGTSIGGSISLVVAKHLPEWNWRHTLRRRIAMLDIRTRDLDKRLGKLTEALGDAEKRLRGELAESHSRLSSEMQALDAKIVQVERTSVAADARALPIIALGVVLGGLSPEVSGLPLWLVVAGIVCAVVILIRVWHSPIRGQ